LSSTIPARSPSTRWMRRREYLILLGQRRHSHHNVAADWPNSNFRDLDTAPSVGPTSPPRPAAGAASRGGGDPSIPCRRWRRRSRWWRLGWNPRPPPLSFYRLRKNDSVESFRNM
jgi:hypothetical protein